MNKKNVLLIDGGMGQELIHRSKIKPDVFGVLELC